MRWKYLLKIWARSRSLRFSLQAAQNKPSEHLARLRLNGREVFFRPGTSDAITIYPVLLKRGIKAEYYLPPALAPEVILDVGSHIGTSILYFRKIFPKARILGFEPHPETFAVLQRNVADLPAVSVFNYGLGAENISVAIPFRSSAYSGFGLRPRATHIDESATPTRLEIRKTSAVLQSLGVAKLDLIKIDCEGSESDVLGDLPAEMLAGCKWITGEMHDESAFKLLALLARHFDLDLRKEMFQPKFRFNACNLELAPVLRGKFNPSDLQV